MFCSTLLMVGNVTSWGLAMGSFLFEKAEHVRDEAVHFIDEIMVWLLGLLFESVTKWSWIWGGKEKSGAINWCVFVFVLCTWRISEFTMEKRLTIVLRNREEGWWENVKLETVFPRWGRDARFGHYI